MNSCGVIFDLPAKKKRLDEIEVQIAADGFWDNPEETKGILKERTRLTDQIEQFETLISELEESEILLELALEEEDTSTFNEVGTQLDLLEQKISKLSLDLLLDGENDTNNAIVSINAGAGGTEAQDWAEMLYRMYNRWVERKGYKISVIDYQP